MLLPGLRPRLTRRPQEGLAHPAHRPRPATQSTLSLLVKPLQGVRGQRLPLRCRAAIIAHAPGTLGTPSRPVRQPQGIRGQDLQLRRRAPRMPQPRSPAMASQRPARAALEGLNRRARTFPESPSAFRSVPPGGTFLSGKWCAHLMVGRSTGHPRAQSARSAPPAGPSSITNRVA